MFDYETKTRYEFDVMANQGHAETHVVIEIIDENDNSPVFSQVSYQASVMENIPIGSPVIQVTATDGDTYRRRERQAYSDTNTT